MESQEGQKAPPAEKDPKRKIMAAIVAAIVVCGALIGYVLYSEFGQSKAQSTRTIVSGDLVTMNYIGRLTDGRVFDTSFHNVASDDARYPKSLTFSLRDNSSYKPFNMTAGNYGTGGTIKGFALGVIGLREGDRATITVLPGEGYEIQSNFTRWQELSQLWPMPRPRPRAGSAETSRLGQGAGPRSGQRFPRRSAGRLRS